MPLYRQFVDAFRQQTATDIDIWFSLIFILSIVLFLLIRALLDERKLQRRIKLGTFQQFLAVCREKGLPQEDIDFITGHARALKIEVDDSLVQSNAEFNQLAVRVLETTREKDLDQVRTDIGLLRGRLGFRPPPRGLALVSTRELPGGQTMYIVITTRLFLEGVVRRVDESMFSVQLRAGNPRSAVSAGQEVYLYFNRSGDARYSGPARVIRTVSDERGSHIVLQHCDSLNRDQRRQDFRVEENRSISVWVMDQYLEESEDPLREVQDRMPERAVLEDLSGGGASLIYHRNLPVNQGVILNIDPGGMYGIPLVRGTVLRCNRRGRADRWAHSIRFEDLRPSEHQKIVRHVFMKERDLLKIA